MKLIECRDICICYEGCHAVKKASFDIDEGEYICIVGSNGSGKTTLMKGLLGLMPLSSGTIKFNGIKQNQIGYLPQQTALQKDFPATVNEVVISGCLNSMGLRPFYSKKEKKRAKNAMELLNITSVAKKSYRELSGGQQQRVLLARAFCATEKLLLLDEPVTGLDPVATFEMYEAIKKLNKEKKVTVIMISHDIKSAVKYADKILHMNTGVDFFGPAGEYSQTGLYHTISGGCNHD